MGPSSQMTCNKSRSLLILTTRHPWISGVTGAARALSERRNTVAHACSLPHPRVLICSYHAATKRMLSALAAKHVLNIPLLHMRFSAECGDSLSHVVYLTHSERHFLFAADAGMTHFILGKRRLESLMARCCGFVSP